MKVMVFACSALDVDEHCGTTISNLARNGHEISIVVAREKNNSASTELSEALEKTARKKRYIEILYSVLEKGLPEDRAKALFERYGLHELFLASDFDYSAITQKNADILSSYRNKLEPDMVIIPYWKSADERQRILARTVLIACRGVGSVLMYGGDVAGSSFNPNVTFNLSSPMHSAGSDELVTPDRLGVNTNIPPREQVTSVSINPVGQKCDIASVGAFESHRLLLLEHEDIDWL
jgi:hypothetical protein